MLQVPQSTSFAMTKLFSFGFPPAPRVSTFVVPFLSSLQHWTKKFLGWVRWSQLKSYSMSSNLDRSSSLVHLNVEFWKQSRHLSLAVHTLKRGVLGDSCIATKFLSLGKRDETLSLWRLKSLSLVLVF